MSLMKIFKCTDRTTSTIGVVIKRREKGKHSTRVGKPKGEIVVNKGMKLIFYCTLKSAINIYHLGLFVSK